MLHCQSQGFAERATTICVCTSPANRTLISCFAKSIFCLKITYENELLLFELTSMSSSLTPIHNRGGDFTVAADIVGLRPPLVKSLVIVSAARGNY